MQKSNDQITVLNQAIAQLGAGISQLNKGMVVRQIGQRIFSIPILVSANVDPAALMPVNTVWFPLFRAFVLKHVNGLGVSSSIKDVTNPNYVGRVNEFLQQLIVAHKYYCTQTQSSDATARFHALVKKQITGDFYTWVFMAFDNVVGQLGGGQSIIKTQTKIDASTFTGGVEQYKWSAPAMLTVTLFAIPKMNLGISITNYQPQAPGTVRAEDPAILTVGGKPIQTLNPTPPQKHENFTQEPVKQALTPTGGKTTVESIKESAEKEVTIKNKRLWLWIAAAAGAGYILKG